VYGLDVRLFSSCSFVSSVLLSALEESVFSELFSTKDEIAVFSFSI
jgi:hypothetical protein